MATSPERSNPLHNFSFPFLKWGKQRKMRCASAFAAATEPPGGDDRRSLASNSVESTPWIDLAPARDEKRRVVDSDDNDGIAAVREKLILDLKTEADRMKDAILRNNNEEHEEEEIGRPWNLRKRRAKCKASVAAGDYRKRSCSSPAEREGAVKFSILRSGSDKTERVKFSVQLTKKEIEEDFVEILGRKPPRRPNKRPKVVQKQLDTLFPGLWLTEVTADSYKVLEDAKNGKVGNSGKKKV